MIIILLLQVKTKIAIIRKEEYDHYWKIDDGIRFCLGQF